MILGKVLKQGSDLHVDDEHRDNLEGKEKEGIVKGE